MERRGQTVARHSSGTIVRILRGQIARQFAVATAVLLALLLRVALAEQSITLPTYVTFYPIVFLAAVLGGMWAGILATTLSALMADYFLLEPVGQFAVHSTSDIVGLAIFCLSGVSVSVVTELYRRSRENLAASTIKAAILNQRRKVDEAGELDETVHAERLRFLEVLESLRATDVSTILPESGQSGRILSAAGNQSGSSGLDQREFRAFLRRTVIVPFIAALVLAGAALWAAYDLNASMQWVDHSDQVIGQSRRLLMILVDLETGERGYLVTGNDTFLQPYQEASKEVDSEYQTLYRLVADTPSQQARLETIHNGIHHWQGYAEQIIALRRAGGEYADLKSNLAGKGEVDQIRDQIAGFQSVEEHLRDERIRVAHRDWRLVVTICIFFGLGIGSGLMVFVFRRMKIIAASFEKSGRSLAESERRWATTLSSIGDGVLVANTLGRVTFLNPVAATLTGWQPEEARGRPAQIVFKTINEETRAPAENIVDRVLKEERVAELANHTALLARDGREIPIADSAAPIFDREGTITGVVVVFHDVTERRRAENVVKTTLQRFYTILSNMNSAVLLVTDEGQTEFANQAFCDVFGFRGEPSGQIGVDSATMIARIKSCYLDPDQEAIHIREIVGRGEPVMNEEIPMRDGRVFLRDFTPLSVDGKTYGRLWVHTDITELKRKEEALNYVQAKMAVAMASMSDSVIITDAEGRFVEFNDAYAKFYRFKNKAECARNFDEFASLVEVYMANGERAPREMYAIQRALRGETGSNVEFRLRRKDTGESWIGSISFSPIRDKDGAITGSVITACDITERKRAEQKLQESEKRYRSLFNEMSEGFCVIEVLFDADGKPEDYRFLEVNKAFEKQTGLPDAVGKRMRELAPDHEAYWFEIYGRIVLTGEPEHFMNEAKALNRWYDVHAYRVGEPELRRVAIVFNDFSDYKRAEEELKQLNRTLTALSNSNQALLHVADEKSFLDEVCRIIIRDCGHAMVWIGVAEHDEGKTVRPVANSGFDEGYLEKLRVRWDESEYGCGPTGTAIRTGEPSMCRNMRTCPEFAPWRADAILRGYASSLVIPLKEHDHVWGAITIYSRETDSFSEAEVDLLKELAGDVESGVQMLRLRAAQARAEEALVESREQLGLFIEYAPAALAMFDNKMRYIYASRRWNSDYGLGDRDIRGLSHYEMFPEIPEEWKEAHRRGLAGEVLSGEVDRFERSDGIVQWVRWEIRPWHDSEGNVGGIVIFSEEISERKKAEEALLRSEKEAFRRQQLQALAERLRQVREEERKMVARDLHDQIGQILTAIKLDVSWVVRHLPESEGEVHSRLARSIQFISDGVRSVRRICSGLRPGILDDLGLAPAIEWQANEFSTRTGIACQVSIPSRELHIDGDRATAIFRIFQECLTNVARHAEAQTVRAFLSEQDGILTLAVEDDGKGFLESEVSGSLGVLGMKERAQVCGGSVQVSSSPGKGTTITVRVPAKAANTERDEDEYSDSR
jgi:PAS domain S-box-containing protein